jgi:trimethylamine--corrinoid protein Co-methyltransferase
MRTANIEADLADTTSFEQWSEEGSLTVLERANTKWKRMLADYEEPPLADDVAGALTEFVTDKKGSMNDAWY